MPKKGYNLNNIESVSKRFVTSTNHPTVSILNDLKKDIILRCPIIPGYNDRKENYDKICELANTLTSIIGVEIEPYHAFGENKYKASGKQPPKISTQTDEQTNEIIDYIVSKTNIVVKKA